MDAIAASFAGLCRAATALRTCPACGARHNLREGVAPDRVESLTNARIFGTDGIRGRAGEGWLSTDSVSALGRAVGEVLTTTELRTGRRKSRGRVLLAHDGRRSGPELEAA